MLKFDEDKNYLKFITLIFLILFATVQFILILRHKSPNYSDSYFYKHTYYQLLGYKFDEAYLKNKESIDFQKADAITANIFNNQENYGKSFLFFKRRLAYSFSAYLVNFIAKNEYLAFLIPVYLAYLGTILLTYYFCVTRFNHFFAGLGTSLLLAFYPFLEWSTYFSTDVIGTFLWLLIIFFAYQYLISKKQVFLFLTASAIVISFLNREQTFLILPLFVILWIFEKRDTGKFVLISAALVVLYGFLSQKAEGGSIFESLQYMRNSFGLYSNSYSPADNMQYILKSLPVTHKALFFDITRHHWWFVFTFMALVSIFITFTSPKRKHILDLLMFSSGLASYIFILWPFFSYRFLFPAVISTIYFTTKILLDYYNKMEV